MVCVMLSEGISRLGVGLAESVASTKIAEKVTSAAGIKNPLATLAVNIGSSFVIDKALSVITNPIKRSLGIDKEMVAHSAEGKAFKNAVGITSWVLPMVMSDKESLKKYGPALPLLGAALLAGGGYAGKKERQECKRLGLLNSQGNSLQNIASK